MKSNNYSLTLDFYAELRKDSKLTPYLLFDRLKYSNMGYTTTTRAKDNKIVQCATDLNGGFIKNSFLPTLARQLDIPLNTIRQGLSTLKKLGWVVRTETGWRLISWKKVSNKYVENLKQIRFKAKTKKELTQLLAYEVIERKIKSQIHRVNILYTLPMRKKIADAEVVEEKYSISCRTLSKELGFKSATTGINLEHALKRKKLLIIKQRNQLLCHIEEYKYMVEAKHDLIHRCFTRGEFVYERLCNNLIPIKKKTIKHRVNTFLKKANMERKLSLINK